MQASQNATETLEAALDAIDNAKKFDSDSWLIIGNEAYISFLLGDKEKARQYYEKFLTIWKDGDPDMPAIQDAKAQLARLRN